MPGKRICVVGAGFVGVTTAVTLAERTHHVDLVEVGARRREELRQGRLPFYEPGLDAAFRRVRDLGRLRVHARMEQAGPADLVFVCVGTPARPDGSADLAQLRAAAEDISRVLPDSRRFTVVVVKSTVPPGATRQAVLPVLARRKRVGREFGLAVNPEFLREGSALADARRPDRIIYGGFEPRSTRALRSLYASWSRPILEADPETVETIKYAANAFLATKIAFANEIGNLCERLRVDVYRVMEGVGLDARIGPQFLRAGVGFGGSCFPKDLAALEATGRQHGVPMPILNSVRANNETQPLRAVELARRALGSLRGRRVALIGLAFKPHTSDVRETRALPIYRALRRAGAEVVCYDPVAGPEFQAIAGPAVRLAPTVQEALAGRDACIVQTEWPEFRSLTARRIRSLMRRPVVVDGRRALDGERLRRAGVDYWAVGLGRNGGSVP